MKLITSWEKFTNDINKLMAEGNIILDKQNKIKSVKDLEDVTDEITRLNNDVIEVLKNSFTDENNDFVQAYKQRTTRFNIPGKIKTLSETQKEIFDDFHTKLKNLQYYKRMLSISDIIIKSEVTMEERQNYNASEILDLILHKLYELYDNSYHSIPMILEGNGIKLSRYNEERELAKVLENKGYLNLMHTREVLGQLTLSGKMYVEEKNRTFKENYNQISDDQLEMNKKIDDVIAKLKKLGYGQEIIFDEIEELKNLYGILTKKNWGQVVKGKLIDLVLSKVIENDTIKYIYETLTNNPLRLP